MDSDKKPGAGQVQQGDPKPSRQTENDTLVQRQQDIHAAPTQIGEKPAKATNTPRKP